MKESKKKIIAADICIWSIARTAIKERTIGQFRATQGMSPREKHSDDKNLYGISNDCIK